MTYEEAREIIKVAKAEVEWDYPLDYQIAFDMAIEALEAIDKSNHICLTCANNREGCCESQDLLSCRDYSKRWWI